VTTHSRSRSRPIIADDDVDFAVAFSHALAKRLGEDRYNLWFRGNTVIRYTGGEVVVGVKNLFCQDNLKRRFGADLGDAAAEVCGHPVAVRFVIDPTLFQAHRAETQAVEDAPPPKPELKPAPKPAEPMTARPVATPKPPPKPQPTLFDAVPKSRKPSRRWRLLGEFIVGACNRVAYAAALSVVEEPGDAANPLVIHGPVGTGKTHLLEGIYAGLRKKSPDIRVGFLSAEEFTNRFVQAMRFGKQPAFRRYIRSFEVLLLDDLHFLATKRATHEEFLHTFDALLADGSQVVVTCDCHPRLADEFPPELIDRLLGGAAWGLQPPDKATRLATLRAKAGATTPPINDEVLRYLADNLRGNMRELEGALHSLRHFGKVTGRAIDLPAAREALGELLRHAVRVVRVTDVDAAVCAVLQLAAGTLQSSQRVWAVSHPRMLAIFLSRKHTSASYGEISRHFGGKSHSSAVAAEKRVRQWMASGQNLTAGGRAWNVGELIERIERALQR
jgi:chromosomal replication initiator protein